MAKVTATAAALERSFAAPLGTAARRGERNFRGTLQQFQGTPAPAPKPSPPAAPNGPSLAALFSARPAAATVPSQTAPPAAEFPSVESVFGGNPFVSALGRNPDGSMFAFNPVYFATAGAAQKVAQMLGGEVVEQAEIVSGGGFSQQEPNRMVRLPGGRTVNAGLVASFFTHGYPQSYIDRLIAREVEGGSQA